MYLALALLAFFPLTAFSKPAPDALSHYQVEGLSRSSMDSIARDYEIIGRKGDRFDVLVAPSKAARFKKIAPKAKLLIADIHEELRKTENTWGPGYHDIASVKADLERLAKENPFLVRVERYGYSKDGRDLFALKLTDNPDTNEGEPQVLLTAATHGNEIITVEVIFGLIEKLTAGYGKDARLTKLVDGLEIYFIPVVNPDGYSARSRYSNGIDPNRDYPEPGARAHDSNPCIANLIKFFNKHDFKGSIDFHSYGELIMFPWAYTRSRVSSSALKEFEAVTDAMANTNGYQNGQISNILYPAPGSSADYYFDAKKTIALGIEIGSSHTPSASAIPQAVKSQTESTWLFLENFL